MLQLWRTWSPTPRLPPEIQDTDRSGRANRHRLPFGSSSNTFRAKKLDRPMEPVAPADGNILDFASSCNSDLSHENTVVVSAITPYQLVRHLTTPITLADTIKTTAMVDSGAMGNFIHLRFVDEHTLVTKPRNPLTINDVNG
jgi:hypothetical protein